MNRHETNLKILEELLDFTDAHPDLRFHQALCACGIDAGLFHEESSVTLQTVLRHTRPGGLTNDNTKTRSM